MSIAILWDTARETCHLTLHDAKEIGKLVVYRHTKQIETWQAAGREGFLGDHTIGGGAGEPGPGNIYIYIY